MANEHRGRGFASDFNYNQQGDYQQDFREYDGYNHQGSPYWQEHERTPAYARLSPYAREFEPGRTFHPTGGQHTNRQDRGQHRQRGRGRKSYYKNRNYRSPASSGQPLRRQPNLTNTDRGESGVNSIQISNARNRLRGCFVEPAGDQVRHDKDTGKQPEHVLSPDEWPTIQESKRESTKATKTAKEQSMSPQKAEVMAANGVPRTPTGPAASQSSSASRTKRLPNHVQIADAYIFQQTIDERLKAIGVTPAREDNLRLAGVQWIDQVRRALKL
jgi:hypothetical protein